MTDDGELLRRYAEQHDQEAFKEIVRRHLPLVFHAGLRQCGGDAFRAQDVAQMVFADLAHKAGRLARRPVLAGWLFTSTRYAAAQAVRTEARRQAREREAQLMNGIFSESGAEPSGEWERLRPVIDDALHDLNERDREALLLRFFEGRGFADVGAKLGVSEDAARMRVERALGKMRIVLCRRGVTSTTAALALAMTGQVVAAVPVGLASTVASAALTTAATGGAATTALTFMSMGKLKLGIAAAIVVAGTGGVIVQSGSYSALKDELGAARQQHAEAAALRAENSRLENRAKELAVYRSDDAELARLNQEALILNERLRKTAEAAAARSAAARASAGAAISQPPPNSVGPDRLPLMRTSAEAVYPPELLKEGIAGEVLVDFIVDSNGNVVNPHSVKSSRREFEAAAIQAVGRWKFDPGVKGRRTVNTHQQTSITFQPPEGKNAPAKPGWF